MLISIYLSSVVQDTLTFVKRQGMLGKRKSTRMDGQSQLKLRQAASSTPSFYSECPIADKAVNNDEDEDTEEETQVMDSGKPRKRARRSQNKSRPE